ncbi:hypothetical protein DS745_07825 [Anaerobacillus alkaliphilus]|uniref:Flagellar protein n=1 Tax=Anaerobacillus alkaliphilus TaxID=1548597 RepID=A0A4V1LGM6_9BACI|nr:TIGR03826 family flagellar region protein [Anaerobacillus alkaliphilus]RXJ02289.1 hypothetical protein DS745_07825 [Anaerobacillus alkaliphilus]
MADILNCPRCNKIFVKNLRDVCTDCYKKEEEDYQTVHQFVRKKDNRMASIIEVEEATGVDKLYIYKFIRQGRIHLASFPNLAYPCESCGKMIREGRICSSCKENITTGVARSEREKDFQARKRADENKKFTTYHSLKDRLK